MYWIDTKRYKGLNRESLVQSEQSRNSLQSKRPYRSICTTTTLEHL